MTELRIHKFGGTSVADAARMRDVVRIVTAQPGQALVVTSAMAGVTDVLVKAAAVAEQGRRDEAGSAVDDLIERTAAALAELGLDDASPPATEIRANFVELRDLLHGVAAVGQLSARTSDRILVYGEKIAVRLLAAAFRDAGHAAEPFDADRFLATDGTFGAASPRHGVVETAVRTALREPLAAGVIPVITGFAGQAPCGSTTTLGRGGSDYTATIIAAALHAASVVIWTDVDGVYTAPPTVVPEASLIAQLNYREAAELSYYGARVLHPKTLQPLLDGRIPALVRNSRNPEAAGTIVDERCTPGSHPVKAVSAVRAQALLNITGTGMAGVPGIARRIFTAIAEAGVNVTMISQSSAESSVCLAVPQESAWQAERALRAAFRHELTEDRVSSIDVTANVGLVAAVGLGMKHSPGVAARTFGSLARNDVNVVAIAQGASELNITFAVSAADVDRAIASVHSEFGLDRSDPGVETRRRLSLLLVGFGRIGRRVCELLRDREETIRARFGVETRVVGIADRSGFLVDARGFDWDRLADIAARKADGAALASIDGAVVGEPQDMITAASRYRLGTAVLLDVSDIADAAGVHRLALDRGIDIVTANKSALASDLADYRLLEESRLRRERRYLAEATVGAGLPVMDALQSMRDSGDEITEIQGCLSGSLTFILSRLEAGQSMVEAVDEARREGYLEPDPMIDLSGEDVRRKAVILSRWAGFAADVPVHHEPAVGEAGGAGNPSEAALTATLTAAGERFAARLTELRSSGQTLRYAVRVASDGIEVGLRETPIDSPLGRLSGTANVIVIRSTRYDVTPLVIHGPGAGVDVTAMGVLTDLLRLAAERSGS